MDVPAILTISTLAPVTTSYRFKVPKVGKNTLNSEYVKSASSLENPGWITLRRSYTLLGITLRVKIASMEHFSFKHICKAPGGNSDVFINRANRMVPLSIRGNRCSRKSVADH